MAHAAIGTMALSLSLNPMGSTGPKTTEYIAPTGTVPIYVYATVTGSSMVTSAEVDGLQYAYFNVMSTLATTGLGAITSATPNAALGFGANGRPGWFDHCPIPPVGSNLVVGSNTDITQVAKPRAASGVYSPSSGNGDGTNIIVNGNSVSFLIETLTYLHPSLRRRPLQALLIRFRSASLPLLQISLVDQPFIQPPTTLPTSAALRASELRRQLPIRAPLTRYQVPALT